MNAGDFSVSRPTLFVAGGAHIDRRARPDGRLVAAASNPGRLVEAAGGASYNAALALRGLGYRVFLESGRGGDADGARVAAALHELGLEDLSVTWLDRSTPSYTAILDGEGELVAGVADMALYDLLSPRLFRRVHVRAAMAEADGLLVDANLPRETIAALAGAAKRRPIGAIGVSPGKVVRLLPSLADLSALFVSRAEAAALLDASHEASTDGLAFALAARGAARAVITDGPRPAAILDRGRVVLQAPSHATTRDVTGAGDTLAAVAMAMLTAGGSFLDAARAGIAAASIRVSAEKFPPEDFEGDIARSAETMAQPEEAAR